MSAFILLLLCIAVLLTTIYVLCRPPRHPLNIPHVPIYVSFLPLLFAVDQEQTYHKYLRSPLQEHGLVKIFFGGRWNLLIQRPAFIATVFKDEDTFQKSGNQKKIPYSVLAEYTGDNIISAHGANWKLYQSVVKPGLQRNFGSEGEARIKLNAELLCDLIEKRQSCVGSGKGVLIPELLQRYTLANLSQVVLGCDFQTLEDENARLSKLQNEVKPKIFNPIFLNFPLLDRLFIPSRLKARQLVREFTDELTRNVIQSRFGKKSSSDSDLLGERLVAAKESGLFTDVQFRHNCVSVFLAGHENPQLLFVSMMYLLAKYPDVQDRLRSALEDVAKSTSPETALQELPLLTSVIYETLRLYPPISQLINRRTSTPTTLVSSSSSSPPSSIEIPSGTYVGYNAYSTGRDPTAWGTDAEEFLPERWGTTSEEIGRRYRRANAKGEFIAFHGGRRACLGQRFALLEARISMAVFLGRFRWELDPSWENMMTPAGPLYAKALRLVFERV